MNTLPCEGEKLLDENGQPVVTDKGFYVYLVSPKPDSNGLALALGFKADRRC